MLPTTKVSPHALIPWQRRCTGTNILLVNIQRSLKSQAQLPHGILSFFEEYSALIFLGTILESNMKKIVLIFVLLLVKIQITLKDMRPCL